ncbi:ComEC family competence protein [Ramlibacter henchirensis]|uniref:ComEC family competence protein n=1 Tax=Ramlibacter henchirensis TaxID=204072 RepID=A0A4Z0C6U1_9BURK|nr:ComEC/Rec2 family competence protein [Ramlibacter henchirensis]TFZ05795.1 ComEC family competence protein [Ramlibacter henchirensis]
MNASGDRRLLEALLGGAVLGAVVQVHQAALWSSEVYSALGVAGAVAALLLGCVARARREGVAGRFVAFGLVVLASGLIAFALAGLRACDFAGRGLDPVVEGRDITVVGTIAAMPRHSELGPRFRFETEGAGDRSGAVRVPRRLSLAWFAGAPAAAAGLEDQPSGPVLRAGDRWQFTVRLRAPHGQLNPHGFDHELWLWEQGVQATGYVRAGPAHLAPRKLGSSFRYPVEQARQAVRDSILARLVDRQAAGVVAALVTGDQAAIDRADWDVFRATGVAHLMSISGLHVTMFAWLAAAVLGAAWRRSTRLCLLWPAPHAALAGGLVLAAAYALFSGWGVPAQRTVLMLAAVGWLRLSGRRWPWPVTWLFACAVVVTADPWALMHAGFWLSFVAVGVLFATAAGESAAAGGLARLRTLLREQAVVTVALAPLSLLLFGQVSLVGLVANLAAIPWVTLVVTPLAMAGVLLSPVWDLAAWAVQTLGGALQWLAGFPFAVWSGAAPPLWAGAAGVVGGLLLSLRWPPPLRALGVPLLLPALLWQPPRPVQGEFELLGADVGQGNAVIVRTARHTLVYDTGPRFSTDSDAGERVLVPLLRALGERVDRLMLSHRDSDHTGGAAAVLAAHPDADLFASLEPGHPLASLRPVTPCQAGQRWEWDGIRFDVLHPTGQEQAGKANAISCVLRVSGNGASALLAGDIEAAQERALLDRVAPLQAQVLLVPHHGSKTSSSAAFLDAVRPRWALVQAGYRNRFGHPAASVVERYVERGAAVVPSDRCGAAWWTSARPQEMRCEREVARRYWHHRPPAADEGGSGATAPQPP